MSSPFPQVFDPSQNFMRRGPKKLDSIFLPKSIAIIGATDRMGSVGRTLVANLIEGRFKGDLYPINPKKETILGLKAYPKIGDLPSPVDLVVIATPAKTVPSLIQECILAKAKSAIVISAGFKELGKEGEKLEKELIRAAKDANLPIIGPNCLGVMNPLHGLNATFARGMALKGNIAFISQSGAMCTAVLDWSLQENIGFSSFVSIGSMADVNFGDLIDYLGEDPYTESILIYMETIGDPRSFLTAAKQIALEKSIIVIKAGRSEAAAKAAASHTGSLAGSDVVFDAALERVGVLRVDTINELFSMASALGRQPLPKGPNLSIVTNAGGPAVLATDAAVASGAKLTSLSKKTIEEMNVFLPDAWSHSNPIDILGDASADRYYKTIEALEKDETTDGILAVLSPQDMTDSVATADFLRSFQKSHQKPLLASWMGGASVAAGIDILNKSGIPTFPYPDDAAKTFAKMWQYKRNLEKLYETPSIKGYETYITENIEDTGKKEKVKKLIEKAREEKRTILSEYESKKVLSAYDIPVVETVMAKNKKEASDAAEKIGYPIVLKLLSETITHKTDVGGVQLNLKNKKEVEEAFDRIFSSVKKLKGEEHFQGVTVQKMIKQDGYELILGSSIDPQFGPVLLFGLGGQLVEVFQDSALALPPLTHSLAKSLMEKTKVYQALLGVRGKKSVNMQKLTDLLVRFSQLIVENRWIEECDINPLLVSADEMIALDARVILVDSSKKEKDLPKLAIRPYPLQYVEKWTMKNGKKIVLRPIVPEDEMMLASFHKDLSENSVRQRYFAFLSLDERIAHSRLLRICFTDYNREMTILAETKEKEIIGVGRLTRSRGQKEAHLTLIIKDAYHGMGLGRKLIDTLLHIAKEEKLKMVHADILSENTGMIHLCKKAGFSLKISEDGQMTYATLALNT